jgi:molybdopterin/thiamine biosynthesis adenylyltransferase
VTVAGESNSILIIGAGGLGTPALVSISRQLERYSSSITLVEHDVVDVTNLNRQFLYRLEDVGRSKAEVLRTRALGLGLQMQVVDGRVVDDDSWRRFFSDYSLVLDCTDSVEAKYSINSLCVTVGIPLIHAAVQGWEGQVMTIFPRKSSCYRCIFRRVPQDGEIEKPPDAGIMGVMSGFVGLMQADQAIRFLAGDEEALFIDQLVMYDMRRQRIRSTRVKRWRECPVCGEIY